MAEGKGYRQTGKELNISWHTVKTHLNERKNTGKSSGIYERMKAIDITDSVVRALQQEEIHLEEIGENLVPLTITDKEKEYLELLDAGKGYKEIAKLTGVNLKKITNEISVLEEKLRARNSKDLLERARFIGLLPEKNEA